VNYKVTASYKSHPDSTVTWTQSAEIEARTRTEAAFLAGTELGLKVDFNLMHIAALHVSPVQPKEAAA
jgi:hypothetical protein